MTVQAVVSRLDSTKNSELASLIPSNPDGLLTRLKRIESILRNGLPTNDKAETSTITHAHAEVEKALEALEDIGPERWAE